jgi:hypothetical protein
VNIFWAKTSIFCFLILMIISHSVIDLKKRLDDDLLYSYTAALSLAEDEKYESEQEHLYDYVESLAESREDSAIRLTFRENYNQNYFLSNITILAVRPFVSSSTPLEHIRNISFIVTIGGLLAGIIVMILSLCAISRIKSKLILIPLMAALSFNAAFIVCEILQLMNIPYYRFGDNNIVKFIQRGGKFFLMPGEDFNVHATRARNLANLLILSIFIVRGNGNAFLAYALCLSVMAIHITYGILAVSIFMLIDMALNPQRLKDKRIIAIILAVSAVGILNSTVWSALGSGTSLIVFVPVALLVIAFVTPLTGFVRSLLCLDRIETNNRFVFEIALVFLGTASACLISFVTFHLFGDNPLHTYTTAELAPRITSMMRLPMIFGLFYILYKFYRLEGKLLFSLPVMAGAMLALGFGVLFISLSMPSGLVSQNANKILRHTYELCPSNHSESVMYSFLACRIDGVCPDSSWNIFDKCKKLS